MTAETIPWRLEIFDTLGSTSDFCIDRAKANAAAGLAVLALTQRAGRGSRGRQWQAPAGNLNLSVLLRPDLPMAQAGMFPLLTGIAVADAVAALLPAAPVLLKWPNDVLLGGAKLAGILIDAAPRGDRLDWLVLGIGINLATAPAIPGRRTAALSAHGGHATPQEAARLVLRCLDLWLARFDREGAESILAEWQLRAHPVGTPLDVQTARGAVAGRYAGLSARGELLLDVGNRIERFQTGEILLGVEA